MEWNGIHLSRVAREKIGARRHDLVSSPRSAIEFARSSRWLFRAVWLLVGRASPASDEASRLSVQATRLGRDRFDAARRPLCPRRPISDAERGRGVSCGTASGHFRRLGRRLGVVDVDVAGNAHADAHADADAHVRAYAKAAHVVVGRKTNSIALSALDRAEFCTRQSSMESQGLHGPTVGDSIEPFRWLDVESRRPVSELASVFKRLCLPMSRASWFVCICIHRVQRRLCICFRPSQHLSMGSQLDRERERARKSQLSRETMSAKRNDGGFISLLAVSLTFFVVYLVNHCTSLLGSLVKRSINALTNV